MPAEVGRVGHDTVGVGDQPRHGDHHPDDRTTERRDFGEDLVDRGGDGVQRTLGAERAQVAVDPVPGHLHPGEVQRRGVDEVTVDLDPDPDRAPRRQLDPLPRPAHAAVALHAGLPHEAAVQQLADQAGDGGLVEPGAAGDPCPRSRALALQVAQHQAEVEAPDGELVRRTVRQHLITSL